MPSQKRHSPDHGTQVWIARTAKRNHWRVARYIDIDDLIQDGYECWVRVLGYYKHILDRGDAAHFMALFKRSYTNYIHNLANQRRRGIVTVSHAEIEEDSGVPVDTGVAFEEASLAVRLSQAPMVVKNLLSAFDTEDGRRALQARLRVRSKYKQTENERLCLIAGADPDAIDMEWELRDAISAE